MTSVEAARELAEQKLAAALPGRWTHVQAVGARAAELSPAAGPDADVLVAAAWLHDIGYGPEIAESGTGFHPLDGARFLRAAGVDERIVGLVAHHTCAHVEAEERGLADVLAAEFPREQSPTADLLWYADLTTGPDGQRVTVPERLAEIEHRYAPTDPVHRFIVRARPEIMAAAARAAQRVHDAPLLPAAAAIATRPAARPMSPSTRGRKDGGRDR
jgi:hypothetical protein